MSRTHHMVATSSWCFSCVKMFMALSWATWTPLSAIFSPTKGQLGSYPEQTIWDCHSPVARAAETWSTTGLTCPAPLSPMAALHAHLSQMCTAQIFQSTVGGFTGKELPWSKQAEPVGTGRRGSRFTRNYTRKPNARDGRCAGAAKGSWKQNHKPLNIQNSNTAREKSTKAVSDSRWSQKKSALG